MIFYSKGQLASMNLKNLCDALIETRDQYEECVIRSSNKTTADIDEALAAFRFAQEEIVSRCTCVKGDDEKLQDYKNQVASLCVVNKELKDMVFRKEAVIHYLEDKLKHTEEFANMFARELNKKRDDPYADRDEHYPCNV